MKTHISRAAGLLAAALACSSVLAAPLAAQASAQAGSQPPSPTAAVAAISLDDAVATALSKDPGVISANLDYLSASSKADSAKWKQLPSLSASGGYTRLSELPSSDTSFNTSITLNGKSMPLSMSLPSILDMVSFGLNLQYPVFTGFRVKESIAIAKLTAQAKDVTRETVKRSLVFDVTRAYWEAVRATYNVATLQKNLELQKKNSDLATRQLGQGVATRADQLAAQMRLEQATEDLDDAQAMERRAYLSLASLTGMDLPSLGISTAALETALPFVLSTKPEDAALEDATKLDEASLVSGALEKRPETRTAELARKLALHAVELSRAALYPTVAITGNFTDADPNQRVAFQTSSFFTPTWALGIQLSYDIGGVPAALDDIKAQALAATKAKSDEDRQREAIVMDVEGCILNLERAARDLASTQSMVGQATENLRVMQGRVAAGSAKDLDLSSTQFDLLRTNFAVTNKLVDLIVAQADLDRATAARDVK